MKYDKKDPLQASVPVEHLVPGWFDNLVLLAVGVLIVTLAQVC